MIFILKFTKRHNSIKKNVDGDTVIVLCILPDDALYLYPVL